MKIAAFNVENLFDRAKAFNENTPTSSKVIASEAELNQLFEKPVYTAAVKKRMITLMTNLGLAKTDAGPYVILRKIRGKLVKRSRNQNTLEIVANGREDWIGWVELKTEQVNEIAIMNTGRVLKDVDADIVAVVEAEHRVALKQFSNYVLQKLDGIPYPQIMLIDGNDDRGIDVGLMTKAGFEIGLMRSHIHDNDIEGKPIFSRDSPEFALTTPQGELLWIIPNHFKSKFGGNDFASQSKRTLQAKRTAEIYRALVNDGNRNVIVLGDLNDTPDSDPLQPLLADTDLKDVSLHPSFDTGVFPGKGTYGLGNDSNKIDYILLSPDLFDRVTASGLFRRGAWPGSRPVRWEVYPELTEPIHAASDHHLIWCEIE